MLRSMTGYGRFASDFENLAYIWEIRSVNGKSLDIKLKLPSVLRSAEERFDKKIRLAASRGRVEAFLEIKAAGGSSEKIFDLESALRFYDMLEDAATTHGMSAGGGLGMLAQVQHFWKDPEQIDINQDLIEALETGLGCALADWNVSREREAGALASDLASRFKEMRSWLSQIMGYAPCIKQQRIESVRSRLGEILAALDSSLDEGRFLQEVVILSDKLDVTEEMTRLGAHLDRMGELLADGRDCGRKLDFTLQEAFREINTCGNKIQDSAVSKIIVDFKTELEKCREQVQNLE